MNRTRHQTVFHRGCLAVCILFFLFTQNATGQEHTQVEYIVRDNAKPCVNVRTQPSTDAAVITCLTPGTQVTVLNTVPFWREIQIGQQRGWIAKKFIEPVQTITPLSPDTTLRPDSTAFLAIHFIDVGQGDAIWIQTYDDGIQGNGVYEGYSILIDGGPYSSDRSNPVLPYLEERGYHGAEMEAVFVTHPHIDHFAGAETISRHFQINHYYDPGFPSSLPAYSKFLSAMRTRANQVHLGRPHFGDLNWGRELKAEVLYSWDESAGWDLGSGNTLVNNSSIVLRIQYGDHVFLLMGDAEGKDRQDDPAEARYVERVLLSTVPEKLKATVLKVAHHGSETSSTIPFIEAVDPEVVVIQSGRKSFSGTFLPDLTTMERYCSQNTDVRIYRTDQGDAASGHRGPAAVDGDHVTIRTNGYGQVQVDALKDGKPFTANFCSGQEN